MMYVHVCMYKICIFNAPMHVYTCMHLHTSCMCTCMHVRIKNSKQMVSISLGYNPRYSHTRISPIYTPLFFVQTTVSGRACDPMLQGHCQIQDNSKMKIRSRYHHRCRLPTSLWWLICFFQRLWRTAWRVLT